jgi:hypothetical protein
MMINNYLGIKNTCREPGRSAQQLNTPLKTTALTNIRKAYWNLPTESLYEEAVFRGEGPKSRTDGRVGG